MGVLYPFPSYFCLCFILLYVSHGTAQSEVGIRLYKIQFAHLHTFSLYTFIFIFTVMAY